MTAPLLLSERLELRRLDLSFCTQQYVDWINDPDIYVYLDTKGNYTIEKLREYLSEVEKKNILFWAIIIRSSGKHIGNIKIDPINQTHGLGEYGILMGERAEWGKGYAKEASETAIDYCFDTLGLRKITLGVIEDNTPAVNLYYKMGFELEGVYKKHGIYNDKYCNALRMALFNSNYTY